jgi:uncharacterized protein YaeQ
MALGATLHRYALRIEDVERGVYADVEVRLARHASESDGYFIARLLAFALAYEDGLAFSDGGLSDVDEPAISRRDLVGRILTWIEIGAPSPERLHRASKRADEVVIYTHRDPAQLVKDATRFGVHRGEAIRVVAFEPKLVDALGARIERNGALEIVHTAGTLYVTTKGETFEGTVTTCPLVGAP